MARGLAIRIPAIARLVADRDAHQASNKANELELAAAREEIAALRDQLARKSVLDHYVTEPPSDRQAFRIFEGEWSSDIPGIGMGGIALFNDDRLRWISDRIGTFAGKSILELGPLEGGHTAMMAKDGPKRLLAIESNTRAFLKCLIVKNYLNLKADFLLGDFRDYVANTDENFDFILASGVLYHMRDPVLLLENIARRTDCIGIWTHYYDNKIIQSQDHLARRFAPEASIRDFHGIRVVMHEQSYLDALSWGGFCGGSAANSFWLTRDSLLGALGVLGFSVEIGAEDPDHPNGPCTLLLARKQ
jgi:hypothetical protein